MNPKQSLTECASVLLLTLLFILTVAGTLAGYLLMVQNSDQLVVRSQCWNAALTLAEAGLEEGLTKLNAGATGNSLVSFGTLQRSMNGGSYAVTVTSVAGGMVTLRSVGSVVVPLTGDTISRTVQINVGKGGMFMMGLVAIHNIQFHGYGIASDSWNSYDPLQSENGIYSGYVGTNGDVCSVKGMVDIGNHTINGDLYLGPQASYKSSAGRVTGSIYTDTNMEFPDASLPTTDTNGNAITWASAPTTNSSSGNSHGNGNTSSGYVHDFTASGYYVVNDSYPIVVEPGVSVTLDVKSFAWNPAAIDINGGTTNSGTVAMYIESGSVTLSGNSNGGASGNRPNNLYVFGLPGVTSITLSSSSSFVGAIYAPEAALTLNGGGNNNNLMGAAVVDSATINGHYDFHYDTALGTNYSRGYVVSSWQEL